MSAHARAYGFWIVVTINSLIEVAHNSSAANVSHFRHDVYPLSALEEVGYAS